MKHPNRRVAHFLRYGRWPAPLRLYDVVRLQVALGGFRL
jgi:hypothetical protein